MLNFYLKRRLPSLIVATLATFLLGFVSAVTFALIGPAVQVMTQPKNISSVRIADLLTPKVAEFIAFFLRQDEVAVDALWKNLPILVLLAAFLRAFLTLIQWFLWEKSSESIACDLREDIIDSYLAMSAEARRDGSHEIDREISSAIGGDLRLVREYLVHFFGGFPRELIQVIFYIVTLFFLNIELAIFFLLGIGPTGFLLAKLGKKLRHRSHKALDSTSALVEWLQQRFSGIETIKQFQTEDVEQTNLKYKIKNLNRLFVRAIRVKSRTSPLMELLAVFAMMLVLNYSLQNLASGHFSSSLLLSFFSVLGILSQSAAKVGRYYNSNKEGEAALRRLEVLMNCMKNGAETMSRQPNQEWRSPEKALQLSGLNYSYPSNDTAALVDVDWDLSKGRIYALAGPSGSGKSTLLKIILGLWRVQVGELKFGYLGNKSVGYLPQAYRLLPGTIQANVAYPNHGVDESRVRDALQKVGLWDLVKQQPVGSMTILGEGGVTLSGGQAQRIGLARLIYHQFPFVIIDEGTSALDPEVEALVFANLKEMVVRYGCTILMVAHRLSALQFADEILVLKEGKQVFKGLPLDFMRDDLWKTVFEKNRTIID